MDRSTTKMICQSSLTLSTTLLKMAFFLDELKLAEAIPLFKKADPFDKSNYRPVSLLSHM